MKKKLNFAYIIIRNTFILFVLLEIGLGIFYKYNDKSGIDANTEKVIATGLYGDLDSNIVKEIYRDLREQDMEWKPYLHYGFKEKLGKQNTIYKNGNRKTVNLSIKDSTTALKIFCFGGSTMYSSGARDAHTIPSELSKLIHSSYPDKNIEVTNFGCHGYTRGMENIQLQLELTENNIPDIVVFYDGVNEVISAHQNNIAGLPTNSLNRKNEFNIGHNYKKRIRLMVYSSNLNRMYTTLRLLIQTNSPYAKINARSNDLAKSIASKYSSYIKISKSLESNYNFKTFNFLQPVIFSKNKLSKYEEEQAAYHDYYKDLYNLSYINILADNSLVSDSTFTDISRVFNDYNDTLYFDFCHTGEKGNVIVAQHIFSKIMFEIEKH